MERPVLRVFESQTPEPNLDLARVAVSPRDIRFTIRDKRESVGKEQAQCAIEGIDRRKELGCLVI
jgi:hypothetical protein